MYVCTYVLFWLYHTYVIISGGVLSHVNQRSRSHGDVRMMAKNVRLSEKSRQKLVEGINIVANAVKVTLGPKVGR